MNIATLRSLYERALALPAPQREALFDAEQVPDAVRAEVQAMLQDAHGAADPIAASIAQAARDALSDAMPARVGPWRILRTLGAGGMGVVLLGERADGEYQRQVAIKLIGGLSSDTMRERFRRERQVLAALDHPNIAGLVDGGTTGAGEPYLVMPYIEGETLREWLQRERPALRTRLQLFVLLCRAVHYAHQHLVVHRDLKPGNVMVRADGTPVLLDFGIAKLLDASSEEPALTATRVMTPLYAAPEQLLGRPVTTATDVHGLGLILYELLAGSVPERGDAAQAASVELPPPSQRVLHAEEASLRADALRIRGDLDRIVRRAVRTEPAARYPSAQALAEDVQAWLEGRPVQAAGRHRWYVFGRFVRRNRWAVAAAVVAAIALANVSLQWKIERDRARAAQALATSEAASASGVTDFLVELFSELDPDQHAGRVLSARELLDVGRTRLDDTVATPELRARLQLSLGTIYDYSGQPLVAIELLEPATEQLLEHGAPQAQARVLASLARAYNSANQFTQGLATAQQAVARLQQLTPPDPKLLAHTLMHMGVAQQSLAQTRAAESSFARAQQLFEQVGARDELASVLHNRGWIAGAQGQYDVALQHYEEAIAAKLAAYGPDHPKTLRSLHGRAMTLARLGRHQEAAAQHRDLVERTERVHGAQALPVARAQGELATVYQDLGDFAQAQHHYERALALYQALSGGAETMDLAITANNMGSLLEDRGDAAGAERAYRNSLQSRRALLPAGHPSIATPLHNLARVLLAEGRAADAAPFAAEALQLRSAALEAGHPLLLGTQLLAAQLAAADARGEEAEALLRQVQRHVDADAQAALRTAVHATRAALARARSDNAARLQAATAAHELAREMLDATHPRLALSALALAEAELAAGNNAAAVVLAGQAAPVLQRTLVPGASALQRLAAVQRAAGT